MSDKKAYAKAMTDAKTRLYNHDMVDFIPEGESYPSVTTMIGVIAKPALYAWYQQNGTAKAKQIMAELEGLFTEGKEFVVRMFKAHLDKVLPPDFWLCGQDKSDVAKDLGTLAHDTIENWTKSGKWIIPPAVKDMIEEFKTEFVDKYNVEVLFSEIGVASNLYKFAGRVDLVASVNGKLAIVDIKTSSGLYPEMALQLSAYKQAYEEMTGDKIEELWVVRLDKKTGKVEPVRYEDCFETFLAASNLWKGLKQIKPIKEAKCKKEKKQKETVSELKCSSEEQVAATQQ